MCAGLGHHEPEVLTIPAVIPAFYDGRRSVSCQPKMRLGLEVVDNRLAQGRLMSTLVTLIGMIGSVTGKFTVILP